MQYIALCKSKDLLRNYDEKNCKNEFEEPLKDRWLHL